MDLLKYFWTNRMPREVVPYFSTLAQLSPQHILCSVKWTTYFLSTSSFSSFFHGQYTFISSTTQQENRASNLSAPVYQCISCTDGPKLDAGRWTCSNELPGLFPSTHTTPRSSLFRLLRFCLPLGISTCSPADQHAQTWCHLQLECTAPCPWGHW